MKNSTSSLQKAIPPLNSSAMLIRSSLHIKPTFPLKKSPIGNGASPSPSIVNRTNRNSDISVNINIISPGAMNNSTAQALQMRETLPTTTIQNINNWYAMLPPSHKLQYTGGTDCPRVITKVKQLTFEEKLVNYSERQQQSQTPTASSLQIVDKNTLILTNLNDDPKKKFVQKEKSYEFDYVQGEEDDNQILFKREFGAIVSNFINGINQSVIVFGTDNSGKSQTMVGTMRDPGMFILALKEIFDILYESPERENTSLKMSMFYNKGSHFYDLLISHEYPLRLIERENGEIYPLGASEVIITNLRTGLKILKIGIDRIENDAVARAEGNIVLYFKCERSESHLNKQAVVSIFKIIKTSDSAYEEMISDGKDECMMQNLMTCLRQLSNVSNKKKIGIVPFRKHAFTEYLRESFVGNSQTTIMCCLNNSMKRSNDTANILRLGNICKKVNSNSFPVNFSATSYQSMHSDLLENIANTVSIWVKEFYGELDKSKVKRVRIVVKLLSIFEKYLISLLDTIEQSIQIDLIKNALFGRVLDLHCKEYSGSITSEDIKEFYIAKIQRYALKSLHDQFATLYPSIHFVLQQLEITKETIIKNKLRLQNLFRQYIDAKRIGITGATSDSARFSQTVLTDVALLTNSDIEKLGFLMKLLGKFQDSADHLVCHNMYIPQQVRVEITHALKDFKFLQQLLIDDGVHLTEETNTNNNLMNMSQMSLRFQTPTGKILQSQQLQHRNSAFKTTHYLQQKSGVPSRESSMSRLHTDSVNHEPIINRSIQENNNKSEVNSDLSDSMDSPTQLRSNNHRMSRSPGTMKRTSSSTSQNEGTYPSQVDSARIRQLQIQLGILPRPKEIFVNNTKLSIKTATSTPTLFISQTQQQPSQLIPETPHNQYQQQQSMPQFMPENNHQNPKLLHNRMQNQRSTAPSGAKRVVVQEEDELVTKIFTNNTRYTTTNWMKNSHKKPKQFIFITQNNSSQNTGKRQTQSPPQNEMYPTHYYTNNSSVPSKPSITGLNFFSGNADSMPNRKQYPEMINTLYQFKLPSLTQTLSRDNFRKFIKE